MEIAKIRVDGTFADVVERRAIPSGLAGGTIRVEYAPGIWDNLSKTVVFRGVTEKDVLTQETVVEIPHETVAAPNKRLQVGFYGVNASGIQIIPTLWADLGLILPGADPSGDPSTDPSLPVWAQIQEDLRELEESGCADPETIGKLVEDYLQKNPPSGGIDFDVDDNLTLKDGVLSVNTTNNVERDNTLPVTSAGVHAAIKNKMDVSEIPTVINTALAQAKESGAFDGEDGLDGEPGTSATHSWNGTVLTVTSASGTSSADLKGEKGDDYVLTDADKTEIAELAAKLVDVPEPGGGVDLTGYATEEFVQQNYQPKGNYLTEVPDDYATKQFVSNGYQPKGNYLTEVPSVYATEEFVKNQIAEAELGGNPERSAPDWNANEGKPGHILNRPFYSTYETVTILDDSMVYPEDEVYSGFANAVPTADTTVTVIWNGTEYLCGALDASFLMGSGAVVIGNGSVMAPEFFANTGEPFLFALMSMNGQNLGMVMPLDGTTELNFSVNGFVETECKTIPAKYIPKNVYFINLTETEFLHGTTNGVVSKEDILFTEPVNVFLNGGTVFVRVNVQGRTNFVCPMTLGYDPSNGTVSFGIAMGGTVMFIELPNGAWSEPTAE